jgi:MoaA/NifB/PqqE/SkfB family radical SAM enzyme
MKLKNFDFIQKVYLHPEHVVKLKNNERPFPMTIEVDLTNHCNHNCSFCCWKEDIAVYKSTLDTKTIKKTIYEMKKLGTKAICFTGGGEPMIHKDFYQILSFTKEKELDCGLITNGSAITKEHCAELINNLQWIRISISGGDAASYNKVQGKEHFERVINNISMLAKEKIKKVNSFKIGIRMLLNEINLYSLSKLAERIKNINGINYLQISPNQFGNDEGKFWNGPDVENEINKTKKILKMSNIEMLTSSFEILSTSKHELKRLINYPKKCYAHYYQITIMADGNVAFCKNARFNKKYFIGNINKSSIEEIWNANENLEIEKWVKPNNCGLICKVIRVNIGVQNIIAPDEAIDPNFIG